MPTVVLGICGGIAAYKSPELVRELTRQTHAVIPVVTPSATRFVTTTTLSGLASSACITDMWDDRWPEGIHIHLNRIGDIFVLFPATANTIAKLAFGLADDPVTMSALAFNGPRLIAPSMHTQMWEHPATQSNITTLRSRGWQIIGPIIGDLASQDHGIGRSVDPKVLARIIAAAFHPPLPVQNHRILITCGGTSESIDPVRRITNQSTGQLGLAIAEIAATMGAQVTVIGTQPPPENPLIHKWIHVQTTAEMDQAVHDHFPRCNLLIMAAAVADFTCNSTTTKIRRGSETQLTLIPTPDILAGLAHHKKDQTIVGFCLNDGDLIQVAQEKMAAKSVDIMIANTCDQIGQPMRAIQILRSPTDPGTPISGSVTTVAHAILAASVA